jgi:tRNA U34 5-methylaminomethyl-2-thiouridine-forming methyltransferase MnmC
MSSAHFNPTVGKNAAYIVTTLDGSETLFSRQFQATYHSLNGAVSESRHVFIQHGLQLLMDRHAISILEFGFGTGLNAFLSFLFSKKHTKNIHYTGLETNSLDPSLVAALNYPEYLSAMEFSPVFEKMHQVNHFAESEFQFSKLEGIDHLPADAVFDCIFFDAFSPDEHPRVWEQDIFDQISAMTSTDGILVTYCAKGEVRRRIERSGFRVIRHPGAPGKREMIQAFKL